MKAFQKALSVTIAAALASVAFVACGETNPQNPDPDENPPAKQTYTVTYNVNGGTLAEGASSSVAVEEGKSVTLPAATKTDYTFNGWYLSGELVGTAGASYTPTATVTLTAEWEGVIPDVPDDPKEDDYAAVNNERAIEYAKLIENLYWNSKTQLSNLTPAGGRPYLWPYTEQLGMVNGILLNMDKDDEDYDFFANYLEELIEGMRHYRVSSVQVKDGQKWENEDHVLVPFGTTDGTANSYAIYNSGRNDNAKDSVNAEMGGVFFDDNIWVAKEFYYAYINLGKEAYLNEAVNIVNWIVGEGYESTKGLNGIYWKWSAKFKFEGEGGLSDDNHASLNACSSAPTAMMLAKLYQTLSEEQFTEKFSALAEDYLNKAQLIYDFCYQVLRNQTTGCLRDKIFLRQGFEEMTDQTQQIQLYDEQVLPYNTGTFMTAGAELYNIADAAGKTNNARVYRNRNTQVAKDADKYFANTVAVAGQYSYDKNSWFTSFLLEGFIDIEETGVDCSEYVEHMRSALDYAWKNNRADDKLVCPAWVVGWSAYNDNGSNSEGNPRQILLQSANAHCYAMLARYYGAKSAE